MQQRTPGRWWRLRSPRQLGADLWPLLQQTLAATLAWLIASRVMQHHIPFFAPIAAVVALNTTLGQRGANAIRLLVGAGVGIAVGELALGTVGTGWLALALATFVASVLARLLDAAPVVTAQAAAGAILTVAISGGQGGGLDRLLDALIGVGVALVFSQLLFPPEPVRLVRRAAAAALRGMADGLRLVAQAYRLGDQRLADQAHARLLQLHGPLADLAKSRRAGGRVARHSLYWQRRRAAVTTEAELTHHLDLLAESCLLLARSTVPTEHGDRQEQADRVQVLAGLLATLAEAPGDRAVRQQTAASAALLSPTPDRPVVTTADAVALVAADLVAFTGAVDVT